MGFRFRRIIGLLPGVRLNLGKRGASVSVGVKGLTANISKHGVRKTVSLPGTGLSYSSYQTKPESSHLEKQIRPAVLYGVILAILVIAMAILALIIMLARTS
jgi:hypothetical protein